jgi:hypothetical protein
VITIERNLAGIVPYRAVFFPTDSVVGEISENLRSPWIARLFWSSTALERAPRVVRHQRTATVCVNLSPPPDELFKRIAKNGRYDIRQAEKMGDRLRIACNEPGSSDEFLELFNSFARVHRQVRTITSAVLRRYQDYSDTFLGYCDERLICGHLMLRDTNLGRARLLMSANRRLEDRETARLCGIANRFLHWHEIRCYRAEGFEVYDFGGIRDDHNDGITQFKMSFGGEVKSEHTYWCAGSPWLGRTALRVLDAIRARRVAAVTAQ